MVKVELGLEETGEMNVASFMLTALIGNTTSVDMSASVVRLYAGEDEYIELKGSFDLDIKSKNPLDKVIKITSYTAVVDGEISYKMSGLQLTQEELASFDALSAYLNSQRYTMVGNNGSNALTSGDSADSLDGGKGNDQLYALDGADALDGGAGSDWMEGGFGGDTYQVDNAGDKVIEEVNSGGTDTVYASVSYSLAKFEGIEKLYLTGKGAIDATGSSDDDAIWGNDGANVIDGGKGVDDMTGGDGNDRYVVDSKKDAIVEAKNGGTDTVSSASLDIDLSKYSNIEDGLLLGDKDLDIAGNSANNALTGNSGDNSLWGGKGIDTLKGGAGADLFQFVKGDGKDVILDFDATGKGQDHIDLDDYGPTLKYKTLDIDKVGKFDVDIDFGNGDHALLKNVNIKDIDASDFLF
jgi:Ca2+-binding RTX toxin-like protein